MPGKKNLKKNLGIGLPKLKKILILPPQKIFGFLEK